MDQLAGPWARLRFPGGGPYERPVPAEWHALVQHTGEVVLVVSFKQLGGVLDALIGSGQYSMGLIKASSQK
ncbi:hypothetical protein [Streptomyces sp. NPDC006307]|uniref:hypothetical protein n=1 Tax=Streptomyces sp. NPDC006307 TaxID=3156748 RepID=UPI0033A0671D